MYKDRDMCFIRVIYDLIVSLWKWWMGSAKNAYILQAN